MLFILIRSLVNALYDFVRMDKKELFSYPRVSSSPEVEFQYTP